MGSLDKIILKGILPILFVIGCVAIVRYSDTSAFWFAVVASIIFYGQYLNKINQDKHGMTFIIILSIAFAGVAGIIKFLYMVIK